MRKFLLIITMLALIGIAVWGWFGGFDRVAADRIENTLVEQGIPQPVAACMGERMGERLSLIQLYRLDKNLQPQEAEESVSLTMVDFLEILRRMDAPEVIEVAGTSAAICSFTVR